MNNIRQIEQLNQREIEAGIAPSASWHRDYNSAYIYIGGLPYNLSEGDVLTIFSQYGEPVWLKLGRDRERGKSKGFAFLKYEDQRSTDLAVDNLSGAEVGGRKLNVDHKVFPEGEVPEEDDKEGMSLMAELDVQQSKDKQDCEVDAEGLQRPLLKEEQELQELMQIDDDDPMKASMIERKQEEVHKAVKRWAKVNRKKQDGSRHHKHRHHHRHQRPERIENGHGRHDPTESRTPSPKRATAHRHHRSRQADESEEDRSSTRMKSKSRSPARDKHKSHHGHSQRRRYS